MDDVGNAEPAIVAEPALHDDVAPFAYRLHRTPDLFGAGPIAAESLGVEHHPSADTELLHVLLLVVLAPLDEQVDRRIIARWRPGTLSECVRHLERDEVPAAQEMCEIGRREYEFAFCGTHALGSLRYSRPIVQQGPPVSNSGELRIACPWLMSAPKGP